MTRPALLALLALAGCGGFYKFDDAPNADYPAVCAPEVYADPKVRDLIAKSTGAENNFGRQNVETLRIAKLDAAKRCETRRGLIRPGGGVERPKNNY